MAAAVRSTPSSATLRPKPGCGESRPAGARRESPGRKKPAMAAEPTATGRLSTSLTSVDAPTTAYLTDASLRALSGELRGTSGKLRAQIRPAGAAIGAASSGGTMVAISESLKSGSEAAPSAGIWKLAVAVGSVIQPIADFNLISTRASSEKRNGHRGLC